MAYSFPIVYSAIQNTNLRLNGAGQAPLGMILLVLPGLLVTLVWGGLGINEKSRAKKILLSLLFVANVILTVVYAVLIDNVFTHLFLKENDYKRDLIRGSDFELLD